MLNIIKLIIYLPSKKNCVKLKVIEYESQIQRLKSWARSYFFQQASHL